MKIFLTGAMSFAMLVTALCAQAAVSDLPTKTVDGRTYHYYEVQPQETVYSICRKLGVSREELVRYNPAVSDGLKAYQQLLFPVVSSASALQTYVVQKRETGYGISRKFKMSLEEFYRLNPEARDGVKEGQVVRVTSDGAERPSAETASRTATAVAAEKKTAAGTRVHVIGEHETLYQIARDNGITLSELLAMNPDLDVAYYKAGTAITVPSSASSTGASGKVTPENAFSRNDAADAGRNMYVVKAHDTFYSIAKSHGLSVEELRAANPGIDILKDGMTLVLPQGCADQEVPASIMDNPDTENQSVVERVNGITVAVALPFMLEQPQRGKQAELYTEFYKGFLLAVDSLRHIGKPVKVLTYDTKGTVEGAKAIVRDPQLRTAQVIIGPDKADQLDVFAEFGRDNNVNVLNLFVVKDDTYLTNSSVMHANIPHTAMYEKAISELLSMSSGTVPVILSRADGPQDKMEFVEMLKSKLSADGCRYIEIEYNGSLSQDDLSVLNAGGRYAFLPVSSKLAELNKILPALIAYKTSVTDVDAVRLWGYPEWLTFRGDALAKMHELDTYVFSRMFMAEEVGFDVKCVTDNYVKWYGCQMANVIPSQGLYGFDSGMFLLKALNVNGGDFSRYTPMYDGVQNCFNFVRVADGGGWVNNEMFIINYGPGGVVHKKSL